MAVRFPETESGSKILEKMLSVSILKLLVPLAGCIFCRKNYENKESQVIH